jgi:gliding motility-associated-like protein
VITASQSGNTNYNAAAGVPQTLTVNKADQTITFGSLPLKTYGVADFTPSATATSALSVAFTSDNPAVATIVSGNIHIVGAGTAVITASQSGNTNYNAAVSVSQTLTVNKAAVMVTADNKTKTYGDVNPVLSFTYTGFLGTDDNSVIDVAPSVVTAAVQNSNAGNYPITVAGGSDNNYTMSYTDGVLTINKADQAITFGVLPAKTYGDADFTPSSSASSGLSVVITSDNNSVATISGSQLHITGAGAAVITAAQPGNGNYNAALSVTRTLTVGKAGLTFTADNKSKEYQAQNPVLTYTVSGYVNGETQSVLDVLPSIQTSAVHNSPRGTYPITITGGSDNNYTFIYIPGTLTITKLQQTISFTGFPTRLLVEDLYTLVATSTSGLPVLFESTDPSIASVSGDRLTGVSKGSVQIRAYHAGDLNYDAAEAFATVEVYSTHKDIMHLFTPNSDGFNDYWELPDLAAWGKCDVKVYGRTGKLVFSDADYNNLWDGTSNGNPLPEGAYYFVIKTQNAGVVKGTVNIVR